MLLNNCALLTKHWLPKLVKRMMVTNNGFPDETAVLQHQTAGHMHVHGKLQTGMLKHKAGHVLKPVQDDERGNREVKFYETIFDPHNVNPVHLELKKIVPKFLGLHQFDLNGQIKFYLKLEDIAQGCEKPCVMDVKIGRKTYDPDASPKKIASENAKYTGTKKPLGFCIPGIWIHQVSTGQILKLDKEYGRSLTPAALKDALRLYLNGTTDGGAGGGVSQALVSAFIQQLHAIRVWFRSQNEFLFYATSLLLVYDASIFDTCAAEGSKSVHKKVSKSHHEGPISRDSDLPALGLAALQKQTNSSLESDHLRLNAEPAPNPMRCANETPILSNRNGDSSFPCALTKEANVSTHSYSFRSDLVRVRMIDFAHVYPAQAERDDNYIEGLENFIKLFESFLS